MGADQYYVHIPVLRPILPAPAPVPEQQAPLPRDPLDPLDRTAPETGPAAAAFGEVPLAPGTGRRTALIQAVLMAMLGPLGAIAWIGAAWFFQLFFMFLGGPFTRGEWLGIYAIAALIAVCGIAMGIISYLPWRTRPALGVAGDMLTLTYPAFRGTFTVPRELVRVITFDDRPTQMFRNNKRFPVAGPVPGEAFKDALDNFPRPPWEAYGSSLPVLAGMEPEAEQYLFSGDGTALPVFRTNPEDVPNIAVIFHEPMRLPKIHPAIHVGPCASVLYSGSRTVRGMLLRVADAATAQALVAPWGLTRQVGVDDVLAEGLFLPKPLRGWRMWVFAGLMVAMVVLKIVMRGL